MSNPFATGRYGGGAGNQGGGGDLTSQIVNTVKQDMESSEKSGQWIFSCYSPAKDCVSVPGMDDISPEELRLEAYVAKSSGTVDQYTNRIKTLVTEYANMREKMKTPDQMLKQTLVKIYNKENISGGLNGGGGGLFSSPAQPSGGGLFGGSSSTSSGGIFGGTTPATSGGMFGGNTSSAGGGIFGKQSTAANSSGIFSPAKPSSVFGGGSTFGQSSQANTSVFGGAAAQNSQSSVFGGSGTTSSNLFGSGGSAASSVGSVFGGTPSTSGSVFGGSSVFGSTSNQSTFGSPAPASSGSIFGSSSGTPTSTFGAAATATPQKAGIFGSAGSGSSIFGAAAEKQTGFSSPQPTGASLFGQSTTSTVVSTTQPTGQSLFGGSGLFGAAAQTSTGGGGLFGKSDSSGTGLFGHVEKQMDPSCIWTPLDQLTEAEKAAYLAPEFELGRVPTRPPPKEWCF